MYRTTNSLTLHIFDTVIQMSDLPHLLYKNVHLAVVDIMGFQDHDYHTSNHGVLEKPFVATMSRELKRPVN